MWLRLAQGTLYYIVNTEDKVIYIASSERSILESAKQTVKQNGVGRPSATASYYSVAEKIKWYYFTFPQTHPNATRALGALRTTFTLRKFPTFVHPEEAKESLKVTITGIGEVELLKENLANKAFLQKVLFEDPGYDGEVQQVNAISAEGKVTIILWLFVDSSLVYKIQELIKQEITGKLENAQIQFRTER